jgi:hypothetical protein
MLIASEKVGRSEVGGDGGRDVQAVHQRHDVVDRS